MGIHMDPILNFGPMIPILNPILGPTFGSAVGSVLESSTALHEQDNKNHDSGCTFTFWQKTILSPSGLTSIRYHGEERGIRSSKWVSLTNRVDVNAPLYMTAVCGDALWVDQFMYTPGRHPGRTENTRMYGSNNDSGWCVSTDRGDWTELRGHSVGSTCYHTLELSPYNTICEGCRGVVRGHYNSLKEVGFYHGRLLDGEPKRVNDFGAVLREYVHCVQTLGDDQACESLSNAALELFDQDDVVILSGESDGDEGNAALTNEMFEDADSNDRRKL